MLALVLVAAALSAQSRTITLEELNNSDTRALASRFLPRDQAVKVIGHRFDEPLVMNGPPLTVIFTGRATRASPTICRRTVHHVPLTSPASQAGSAPLTFGPARPSSQIALRRDCADATAIFAHVQPGVPEDSAVAALAWLAKAQATVASRRGTISVSCHSTLPAGGCGRDPVAAFAGIPLHNAYIIDRDGSPETASWSVTVSPRPLRPGRQVTHPVWDVRFEQAGSPSARIALTLATPSPF